MNLEQWLLAGSASALIGMSKTLHSGLSMIFVPLMAAAFGARASSGIILPLLCAGDLVAISIYRRKAHFPTLLRIAPWTVAGIGLGLLVGGNLPDRAFRSLLGAIILVCVLLSLYQERKLREGVLRPIPGLAIAAGVLAGFTTMIGNAAGPILSIYLLVSGLPRDAFIGTSAWFFFGCNLIKLPLQAFVWKTIGLDQLRTDLGLLPFLGLGLGVGFLLARHIPERGFRILVYVLSFAASGWLILRP